jgi:hypothetical protein
MEQKQPLPVSKVDLEIALFRLLESNKGIPDER